MEIRVTYVLRYQSKVLSKLNQKVWDIIIGLFAQYSIQSIVIDQPVLKNSASSFNKLYILSQHPCVILFMSFRKRFLWYCLNNKISPSRQKHSIKRVLGTTNIFIIHAAHTRIKNKNNKNRNNKIKNKK